MRHAKRALLAIGTGIFMVSAACSDSAFEAAFDGDSEAPGQRSEGDASSAGAPGPTARGILLVHAARFPSFRLCFENFPDLPPQPEAKLMPEANVVGVEVGSLVRIDPLQAPGAIYVIEERHVREKLEDSAPVSCRERLLPLDQKTENTLRINDDYFEAGRIDRPLGVEGVNVLAITGCANEAILDELGVPTESCGPTWSSKEGNLRATVLDLSTTEEGASETRIPVQLFQLSEGIEAFKGVDGRLEVTFGPLDGDAGVARVPVPAGALFEAGEQTALDVDQSDPSVYGTWGFRVEVGSDAGTFTASQSLADVQELSSPRELPTTYYRAASNYALLLVGDPTHTQDLADGGVNARYNPRRSVHLLAVPVIDPSAADAGADGGAEGPEDGG